MLSQGRQFLHHVIPAVLKPARTLWNEVIGFLFLCLGVIFAAAGVRAYLAHEGFKVLLSAFTTLIMAWFGIGSFLRARKISRS